MASRNAFALALSCALSLVLLAGCFTGERPRFSDDPFPTGSLTGDSAIDAVLQRFDRVTTGPVTATYDVLTKFGNTTRQAMVVLDGGSRSVTVGSVRFIQTPADEATCAEDGSLACTQGLDATRVSDVGITIDFYAAEAATRLRRDSQSKIGTSRPHAETIAGQPALCVDVTVAGGVAVYCALDSGLVARLDDGDVAVNLAEFGSRADPTRFLVPST